MSLLFVGLSGPVAGLEATVEGSAGAIGAGRQDLWRKVSGRQTGIR